MQFQHLQKLQKLQKYLIPAAVLFGTAAAWHTWRWQGLVFAVGALVMWILLHFTRSLSTLKRAANRPIGFVSSAVMLNARLHAGTSLLRVIALTKSLGKLCSEKNAQPEVFRWTDAGDSHVTCTFVDGKLTTWQLQRPAEV